MKKKFVSMAVTVAMLFSPVAATLRTYANEESSSVAAETEILQDQAETLTDANAETLTENDMERVDEPVPADEITENIASGGEILTPDDSVLNDPVMTPENREKLDAYKEKLLAEMESEGYFNGSESAALSADTTPTFNQYLADYNYNFNCYDFYKNEFKMPYRSYVETRRDSAVYQGLLGAWRIATFQLSDVTKYSNKEIGFYETILFDVLYQGQDVESLSGALSKSVNSIQPSSLKKISEFLGEDFDNMFYQNISSFDSTQLEKLNSACQSCDELTDVFGAIGNISKILSYVDNIEELVYKLAKAQVIAQRSNETAKILMSMQNSTSNVAFKSALDNMILICSNTVSEEAITYIFSTEMITSELSEYVLDGVWTDVLSHLNLYGFAVSAGQAAGKLLSGWLFSTDESVELYYSLCALYEFEDALKTALNSYEKSYLSYNSNANSSIFNEAYKMLLQTHLLGIKASKDIVEIEHESGLLNTLLNSFDPDKYDDYYDSLQNIQTNIELTIKFMSTVAYNGYIDEYGGEEADWLNIQKEPQTYTEDENNEAVIQLSQLSFAVNNIVIDKNMTLEGDMHTYGSILHKSGTLNINGHTLDVDGDYIISGGTAVSTDEETYGETYYTGAWSAYLNMTNVEDRVVVNGDFITYGPSHNGNLTAGTMELKGNFEQHGTSTMNSGNSCYNFNAGGVHKVVFNGTGMQTISFDDTDSGFKNVDFLNDNIKITTPIRGITLNQDLSVKETKELSVDGVLDLNGHTLTFPDGLLHKSGTLKINNGELNVVGDYIISGGTAVSTDEETYGETYYTGAWSAYLNMTNVEDRVVVNGDFITYGSSHNGNLTAGTMELKGNFEQHGTSTMNSGNSCYNFNAGGVHKVVFNGTGMQTISFDSTSSGFRRIYIENKTGPIVFKNKSNIRSTLMQPGGAEIINRDNVTLQGKAAFVDYGDLNSAINQYVGNAENVIPTWMDYEEYVNRPALDESYIINDITISNEIVTVNITKASDISGKLILASYTENGILVDIKLSDITLTVNSTDNIDVAINTHGAAYITAFIWDDVTSMQPVSNKEIKELII